MHRGSCNDAIDFIHKSFNFFLLAGASTSKQNIFSLAKSDKKKTGPLCNASDNVHFQAKKNLPQSFVSGREHGEVSKLS